MQNLHVTSASISVTFRSPPGPVLLMRLQSVPVTVWVRRSVTFERWVTVLAIFVPLDFPALQGHLPRSGAAALTTAPVVTLAALPEDQAKPSPDPFPFAP